MNFTKTSGAALLTLGVAMQIPFFGLAVVFDYPGILRQPAAEVLAQFAAGGPGLLAWWYAFALVAVAMIPVAVLLGRSLARRAGPLAQVAMVLGIVAGVAQAVGLLRWVFVVPLLAQGYLDPASSEAQRAAIVVVFQTLHQNGGVAIGEHLGQLLTVGWVLLLSVGLWSTGPQRWPVTNGLGLLAGLLILAGLAEGFATVHPFALGWLEWATPVGFILLSGWMIVLGARLWRQPAEFLGETPAGFVRPSA